MKRKLQVAICAAASIVAFDGRAQDQNLYEAIRRSDLPAVQEFISEGGDVNQPVAVPNGRAWHPLKIAVYDREEEIALALLEAGAQFEESGVIVHTVAGEGLPSVLRYLLRQDPSRLTSQPDDVGLAKAAIRGYQDVVEVLVVFGRSQNVVWGQLLSEAASAAMVWSNDDIARFLFENGARPEGGALHVAAGNSSPGMVRYLLSVGADPREEIADNSAAEEKTPIEFAWAQYSAGDQGGDREMVLFELIRAGAASEHASLESAAVDGFALLAAPEMLEDLSARLVLASRLGFFDVVDSLVTDQASMTRVAWRDAMIAAIETGHNDIARLLLRAGSPVDGGVLHAAAGATSPGLVRDVLRRGADAAEVLDGGTAAHNWLKEALAHEGPNSAYVLHELIRGGVDVCWILGNQTGLSELSRGILRDTATACWPRE